MSKLKTLPLWKNRATARTNDTPLADLAHGQVTAREDDTFFVCVEHGRVVNVVRAAACLLEPEIGDTVLLYEVDNGPGFILSVLTKACAQSTLAFPGDVRVRAKGDVAIQARDKLSLQGAEGHVGFAKLSLIAAHLDAKVKTVVSVCDALHSTARFFKQTLRDSLRRIKNMETVEAERLRTRVDKRYALKAGNVKLRAKQDMSMDGERIHLG